MVYNNTEFMGVPWESVIKMYWGIIGADANATCKEYLLDFLEFIRTDPFCTPDHASMNLQRIASDAFGQILSTAQAEIKGKFLRTKIISIQDQKQAFKKTINKHLKYLEKKGESSLMESIRAQTISTTHWDMVEEPIDDIFPQFTLSQSTRKALHKVFHLSIKSAGFSNGHSSIVVAGFGEDEIFPTLCAMKTDGIVGNKLKSDLFLSAITRDKSPVHIVPFAQSEMVNRFMEGIDPEFLEYLHISLAEQLYLMGRGVLDAHRLANDPRLKALRNVASQQGSEYFERAKQFRFKKYVYPVMAIMQHLPKEALGNMAEALVNLTSLKRRISQEQETVGGPIDVAVISKGDGFVWIKRKHYIDPALNLHYISKQSNTFGKGQPS